MSITLSVKAIVDNSKIDEKIIVARDACLAAGIGVPEEIKRYFVAHLDENAVIKTSTSVMIDLSEIPSNVWYLQITMEA